MSIAKTRIPAARTSAKQAARKPNVKIAKSVKNKPTTTARTATTRSKPLNEQFTRQAQDMFRAAQDAKIPEQIQAIAEDGVAKTREAYQKIQSATKDNAKVVE